MAIEKMMELAGNLSVQGRVLLMWTPWPKCRRSAWDSPLPGAVSRTVVVFFRKNLGDMIWNDWLLRKVLAVSCELYLYIYITTDDSMLYIYTVYWLIYVSSDNQRKNIGGVLRNVCLLCTRLKAIKLIPLADGLYSTLQIITDTSTWSEVVIPFP